MPGVRIHVPQNPTAEHREAVLGQLLRFNAAHGYPGDAQPLAVLLMGEGEGPAGGLWGRTGYGWLFVELLVVPEALRGRNLGAELLGRAETIAAERGCIGAWLTTFDFQARGFYEKLGYSLFGRIDDSPPGSARLFLSKRFDGGGSDQAVVDAPGLDLGPAD